MPYSLKLMLIWKKTNAQLSFCSIEDHLKYLWNLGLANHAEGHLYMTWKVDASGPIKELGLFSVSTNLHSFIVEKILNKTY